MRLISSLESDRFHLLFITDSKAAAIKCKYINGPNKEEVLYDLFFGQGHPHHRLSRMSLSVGHTATTKRSRCVYGSKTLPRQLHLR